MEKRVVLLRGLPGSGKSTAAAALGGRALSTDDYFRTADGRYVFRPERLPDAHRVGLGDREEKRRDECEERERERR